MTSKQKESEENLVTVLEAAALKNVSKARVHQWIAQGRLNKEMRFGRVVLRRGEVVALKPMKSGRPRRDSK